MKRFFIFLFLVVTGFLPGIVFSQYNPVTKIGEWGTSDYYDIFVQGNYAYCAANNAGLDIIDISDPSNPKKVGNYDIPGEAKAVYVSGNYAYMADARDRFYIIDISNPSTPTLTGSFKTSWYGKEIHVKGNYAYVIGMNNGGLKIIDVSNPSSPVLAGSYDTSSNPFDVYVKDSYAYVADPAKGLLIIDITKPSLPTLTGSCDTSGYARGVHVIGNFAYVTVSRDGLDVIDVTNPAAPVLVGNLNTPGYARELYVKGNYAYVANYENELQIIDISSPSTPTLTGSIDTSGHPNEVHVMGNYAYVVFGGGLEIFDVSTPSTATPAGSFNNSGLAYAVHVSGNVAYLAHARGGLQIIDVSDPSTPTRIGKYEPPWKALPSTWDIYVRDNYAYVLDDNRLDIVDISNPSTPTLTGYYTTSANYLILLEGVYVSGNYAYIWANNIFINSYSLYIIDVSDPSTPILQGSFDQLPSYTEEVYVTGNHAYVVGVGLKIIDVSQPGSPSLVANYDEISRSLKGVYVRGHYAYAADFDNKLWIIDVSNPASPSAIGNIETSGKALGVYVSGNYAYVIDSDSGLLVIDVSNPSSPILAGSYDTLNRWPEDVYVRDNYAYVANGSSGKLLILHFDNSVIPPRIQLNRTTLYFAASNSGAVTDPQLFFISHSGGGTLNWTTSVDQNWLNCSPSSGNNDGEVSVSVDAAGLSAGTYTGTIAVSDPNTINSPQTVSVTLQVYNAGQTSAPFGLFATPTDGSTVSSSIPVTGWVLDDIGVQSVQIFRGNQGGLDYIGDAVLVEGARPDVEQAYPEFPMNYKAGWGYMLLTNFLPNGNGTFTIYAVATDMEGHQVELGDKTILVDNANAVKPFGAIDTPTQGGAASGSDYRNYGWVLTPLPNTIPTDGSTIEVWVDGVSLGSPVYNRYRDDIATLFPGYNNSDGAVGYFDLDTTQLTNGVHTIYWTATDDAGNSDGIGSRYFTVQNSLPPAARGAQIKPIRDGRPPGPPVKLFIDKKPVGVVKGFKKDVEPQEVYPDDKGIINIKIKELQHLEIHLGNLNSSSFYSGYHVVGNQFKPLPIGSTLDMEKGIFYWRPEPGYVGQYRLAFIEDHGHGNKTQKEVWVSIMPKF